MVGARAAASTGAANMSGIVSGLNYDLLFAPAGSSNYSANILSILYNGESSTSGTTTFVSSGRRGRHSTRRAMKSMPESCLSPACFSVV